MAIKNRILPWMLSAVLMTSALLKAVNMHSFALETMLYMEAYMPTGFVPYSEEAAIVICSVELLTAMLFLHSRFTLTASCVAFVILSLFVCLTGVNLFIPTIFGSIESCGCFGELVHFSPLASFLKSVVLCGMAVAAFVTQIQIKSGEHESGWRSIHGWHLYVSLFICVLPPVYSLLMLQNISEWTYLAGYITLCTTIICYTIIVIKKDKKYLKEKHVQLKKKERCNDR